MPFERSSVWEPGETTLASLFGSSCTLVSASQRRFIPSCFILLNHWPTECRISWGKNKRLDCQRLQTRHFHHLGEKLQENHMQNWKEQMKEHGSVGVSLVLVNLKMKHLQWVLHQFRATAIMKSLKNLTPTAERPTHSILVPLRKSPGRTRSIPMRSA